MSKSGKEIQEHQKNIGIRTGEIREIERSLEEKNRPEAAEEFEKILSLPLVRTIDVEGALIKVYTKTINIEHGGKKYEIGDAIIKIDTYENETRINIVGSTSVKMNHPHTRPGDGNFCFGDFYTDIYDNISSGNFYQAVLIILHSLQTIEVAVWGDRMNEWKEVK